MGKYSRPLFGVYVGWLILDLARASEDPRRMMATIGIIGTLGLLARMGIEKLGQKKQG